MDEPELPSLTQLGRSKRRDQRPPRISLQLNRKRTHSDYEDEPATSSDPATFSSDETAPGAENYASGHRKKRHYKGAWWDRLASGKTAQRKKRDFQRNFDSGIFMGSESEEPLSSDSFTMEDEFIRDQRIAEEQQQSVPWLQRNTQTTVAQPRAQLGRAGVAELSAAEQEACKVIQACLENGSENVDLSSFGLSSLPEEIAALSTLSKQAEITPGMLRFGTDMEPQLRLYLGVNQLTKVPSSILGLRNLRFLSLRNNNLTRVPAAIRELVNLESLNLAGNQLADLPTEMLDLVSQHRLRELILNPNPWTPYQTSILDPVQVPDVGLDSFRVGIMTFERVRDRFGQCTVTTYNNPTNGRIPSLTEVVLRKLSSIDPAGETDFSDYMPENSPSNVMDSLTFLKEHPGRQCTTCRRSVVHGGREWLEWWNIFNSQRTADYVPGTSTLVPFRRVQCWEGCRPSL
jgi:hypothetical protein